MPQLPQGNPGALKDPTSLHGVLKVTDCRACHTEHRGPQGNLTAVDEQAIDHNLFGFSLAAHETASDGQPFACADCHTERLTRFEPARCETCHREEDERFTSIHVQEYGTNCRACHEGTDFFSKDRFDHNQLAFPLLGKHAQVRCIDCHQGVTSLADFKEAPTDCAGCHLQDNPHPPNFGTDCARCHNTEGWPTEIFDHNLSAFKLTGKHVQVECKQCHVNYVFTAQRRSVQLSRPGDVHAVCLGVMRAVPHTITGCAGVRAYLPLRSRGPGPNRMRNLPHHP